jgi:hypothetical protein
MKRYLLTKSYVDAWAKAYVQARKEANAHKAGVRIVSKDKKLDDRLNVLKK